MSNKNEINNKTIDVSGMNVPIEGFFMKEKRYALTPLEHKVLSESDSKFKEWSKRFLLISIGLGLTMFSKLVWFIIQFKSASEKEKTDLEIDIENWEFIYLLIGLTLSIILYIISKTSIDNGERKKVMKKIKEYFDGK